MTSGCLFDSHALLAFFQKEQGAKIKAKHPISCADCFALACAINHSAVLVTGDPEFAGVAHLATIEWIR